MRSKKIAGALAALAFVLSSPVPSSADSGTLIATVGGGAASQPHFSGAGGWTFDLVAISGALTKVTVEVRVNRCSGGAWVTHELRKPSAGMRIFVTGVPFGNHCATVVAQGATGSTAEFAVTHPAPPPPGSVLITEPLGPRPFHLSSARWDLYVAAVVVGEAGIDATSTSDIDWYDCMDSCALVADNMPRGSLSLSTGTHSLIASLGAPGSGPQDAFEVIVHEELTVTLATITVAANTAYVPVSVTDNEVGVYTRLEPRVITQDEGIIMQKDATTDSNGNATLALRFYRPGTYRVEVHAMTHDGWRYGLGTGSFTK